jgi:hypothetical protein
VLHPAGQTSGVGGYLEHESVAGEEHRFCLVADLLAHVDQRWKMYASRFAVTDGAERIAEWNCVAIDFEADFRGQVEDAERI